RAVEGELLLQQQVGELVLEDLAVGGFGEVALRAAPFADRRDHPTDQLPHAALALGGAQRTSEVLRHHDVGGELRPCSRHLDVALLEDGLAALALDHGRANVPLDLVVRLRARGDEVPREAQPGTEASALRRAVAWGRRLPRIHLIPSLLPRPLPGHRPPRSPAPRYCVSLRQGTGYSTICCAVNRTVTEPSPACNRRPLRSQNASVAREVTTLGDALRAAF